MLTSDDVRPLKATSDVEKKFGHSMITSKISGRRKEIEAVTQKRHLLLALLLPNACLPSLFFPSVKR